MCAPWLREADVAVHPDARAPGFPGQGRSPVIPARPKNIGEDTPWARQDWRNAQDYGAFHSSSRPAMSSDIGHPSEVLDPNNRHHQPWLAQAAVSEDPENDPWGVLNGSGHTFEDLVQNHMSHHQNMSPDQAFQGKVWYRAAHDSTKDVAEKTIGDHERTVAVDSALSPVKDWDLNNEQMIHYLTNYNGQEGYRTKPKNPGDSEEDPNNRFRVKAPDPQNEKAHWLLDAPEGSLGRQDYLDKLAGPKTSSFFNNILDDTPLREPRPGEQDDEGYYEHPINPHTGEPDWRYGDQDVTVDTHHARVQTTPHGGDLSELGYETPPHFDKGLAIDGKDIKPGYDVHARASAEATRRLNAQEADPERALKPKQAQAGPWVKFKKDVVDAGVSPNMPEPGTAPKSFNPKRPNKLRGPYEGEPDQPRYQRDVGDDWFIHPDKPRVDPRTAPNWGRRTNPNRKRPQASRQLFAATDDWLHNWIAQTHPHRATPQDVAAEGGTNPWEGPEAEGLAQRCQYCGADAHEPHETNCPTNHSDSPRDWAMDSKAVGRGFKPGPEHDPRYRLNSYEKFEPDERDLPLRNESPWNRPIDPRIEMALMDHLGLGVDDMAEASSVSPQIRDFSQRFSPEHRDDPMHRMNSIDRELFAAHSLISSVDDLLR